MTSANGTSTQEPGTPGPDAPPRKWWRRPRREVFLLIFGLVLVVFAALNMEQMFQYYAPVPETPILPTPAPRPPAVAVEAPPPVEANKEEAAPEPKEYTVVSGDTLIGRFSKNEKAVCELNKLADCNKLVLGQKLLLPEGVEPLARKVVMRDQDGWLPIARLNVDPYGPHRTPEMDRKILKGRGYTPAEVDEYLEMRAQGKGVREEFSRGTEFLWMAFGKAGKSLANLKAVWRKPEGGTFYQLSSGRNVVVLDLCGNLTEVTSPPPKKEEPPPSSPPTLPPPASPSPDEPEGTVPFHGEPQGQSNCELQAGLGLYGNRVYDGKWAYVEGICYIWKDGEWQAGPGAYAMYGDGESAGTAFRNKEYGIGLQVGAQRNWVNDRNRLSTFDLKLRLLSDKSWGSNPDSGYAFTQKGGKFGVYTSYAERTTGESDSPLVGVIGEYWKSFGQKVTSTWAAQPVQDRGSVSLSGFYETNLSDDGKWRQRFIAGWARTNWDKQDWARGTYEVRYDDWLMFGPQVTLPIGISDLNKPLSSGDLTTFGAFVRVELGKKVREADADSREAQIEFLPAIEAAKPTQ